MTPCSTWSPRTWGDDAGRFVSEVKSIELQERSAPGLSNRAGALFLVLHLVLRGQQAAALQGGAGKRYSRLSRIQPGFVIRRLELRLIHRLFDIRVIVEECLYLLSNLFLLFICRSIIRPFHWGNRCQTNHLNLREYSTGRCSKMAPWTVLFRMI